MRSADGGKRGLDTSWRHAFDVRFSPALPSIIAVGIMLFGFFIVWLVVAQNIYTAFRRRRSGKAVVLRGECADDA